MRDAEKAPGGSRPANVTTHVGDELSDSEDEGEELLKNVRDRKQSIAKLNISPQEKDLIHRLSSVEEGMFIKVLICSALFHTIAVFIDTNVSLSFCSSQKIFREANLTNNKRA